MASQQGSLDALLRYYRRVMKIRDLFDRAPPNHPACIQATLVTPPSAFVVAEKSTPPPEPNNLAGFTWSREIHGQKWMSFYTHVLAKFSGAKDMKVTVRVGIPPGRRQIEAED
jgi:hypothetical protein